VELIKRKLESDREQLESDKIRVDIIDGMRLSIRCHRTSNELARLVRAKQKIRPETVINFTKEETKKIKEVLNRMHI